ncbi:hypothetical protein BU17DRAFT_83494 [Hysterangium stoloniferum]|nr:hypothetical protein BU17DRAFT_83494 [Hysterangium stoloniferum]
MARNWLSLLLVSSFPLLAIAQIYGTPPPVTDPATPTTFLPTPTPTPTPSANGTATPTTGNGTSPTTPDASSSALLPPLSGVSPCVSNCLQSSVAASNCASIAQVACFCTSATFKNATVDCISRQCPDELPGAETLAQASILPGRIRNRHVPTSIRLYEYDALPDILPSEQLDGRKQPRKRCN